MIADEESILFPGLLVCRYRVRDPSGMIAAALALGQRLVLLLRLLYLLMLMNNYNFVREMGPEANTFEELDESEQQQQKQFKLSQLETQSVNNHSLTELILNSM